MLRLPDSWTWDFWLADTGTTYHLYFLRASRALLAPDRRHKRASVGHATSTDLLTWTLQADALVPGDEPGWDDLATWTGSVVQAPDGAWHMFYTGATRAEAGRIQRIGVATSDDLYVWRQESAPLLTADHRWYEAPGDDGWHEEAWRDPWVFADPAGDGWHMLITGRARSGPVDDRGVVAHARSHDLRTWEVQAPLSAPGAGFGQLEVLHAVEVDGRPTLLFSCLATEMAGWRSSGTTGGIWTVPCTSLTGPFEIGSARQVTDDSLYSGRLVQNRSGDWVLLAFHNTAIDGSFGGYLSDPMPMALADDGTLRLAVGSLQ